MISIFGCSDGAGPRAAVVTNKAHRGGGDGRLDETSNGGGARWHRLQCGVAKNEKSIVEPRDFTFSVRSQKYYTYHIGSNVAE